MSALGSSTPSRWTPPREHTDWGMALLTSPWLWGTALTVGFYQLIPQFPSWSGFLNRYFNDHWILQVETGAAILAACVLVSKAIGLIRENRSLRQVSLDQVRFESNLTTADRAQAIASMVESAPKSLLSTHWMQRIVQVCEYVLSRNSSEGLEGHLKYRADLALERLTASLSFVRTVTWAIPILGFLGTVIGITMSLSSLKFDPNQLAESFEQALVGLGIAFDTTALALSFSLGLVFATYLVERAESAVLGKVEELGVAQLIPLLPVDPQQTHPFTEAETQAASHLLERTESLVNWQTGLWQSALEGLRTRWIETAESQQDRLNSVLAQGMQATLSSHAADLASARTEFLEGFRTVSREMASVASTLGQHAASTQAQFVQSVEATWQKLDSHLVAVQTQQSTLAAETTRTVQESFGQWHSDLERTTALLQSQLVEVREQTRILRDLSAQTNTLESLQSTLTHNLQVVRAIDAFEETIQSLNAAIHLLSARSKGYSAAA